MSNQIELNKIRKLILYEKENINGGGSIGAIWRWFIEPIFPDCDGQG